MMLWDLFVFISSCCKKNKNKKNPFSDKFPLLPFGKTKKKKANNQIMIQFNGKRFKQF